MSGLDGNGDQPEKLDWASADPRQRSDAVDAALASDALIDWPALEPFVANADPPEFPPDLLPEWMDVFARQLSEELEVPYEATAMLSLAALAISAAPAFEVEIRSGWREVLALWVLCPLESGERKSALLGRVLAPIHAWEREEQDRLRPEVERAERAKRLLDAKVRKLEQAGDLAAQEELARLETPSVPRIPRLLFTDATPEAIAGALAGNAEAIALASTEGEVIGNILGRYNRAGSSGPLKVEVHLKGYSGEAMRVDRIGREAIHLERPALSLVQLTQPSTLAMLSGNDELGDRGLVQRALFVLPKSRLGRRRLAGDRLVSGGAEQRYSAELRRVLGHYPHDLRPARTVVVFSHGAERQVVGLERDIEPSLAAGEAAPLVRSFLSKLTGKLCRVAALLAVADGGDTVESSHFGRARGLQRFLEAHFRAALGDLELRPEERRARDLARWAERRPLPFSERDVCRMGAAGVKSITQARAAIEILTSRGYLRAMPPEPREGPGRKPSVEYCFRPGARVV